MAVSITVLPNDSCGVGWYFLTAKSGAVEGQNTELKFMPRKCCK